jgi:hypothetical protein
MSNKLITAVYKDRHIASGTDKAVLLYLANCLNEKTQKCFPSVRKIASATALSKTAVMDALFRLRYFDIIVVKGKGEYRGKASEYGVDLSRTASWLWIERPQEAEKVREKVLGTVSSGGTVPTPASVSPDGTVPKLPDELTASPDGTVSVSPDGTQTEYIQNKIIVDEIIVDKKEPPADEEAGRSSLKEEVSNESPSQLGAAPAPAPATIPAEKVVVLPKLRVPSMADFHEITYRDSLKKGWMTVKDLEQKLAKDGIPPAQKEAAQRILASLPKQPELMAAG